MSAHNEELHELAAAYALDALDPDERQNFEAHLETCATCTAEVREFRDVAGALAQNSESTPPPGLKAGVMGEISRTPQAPPNDLQDVLDLTDRRARRANRSVILAAAAAALVVIVGVASLLRDDGPSPADVVLDAPDAVTTTLEGETGSIEVVWSDALDQVAIFGSELPEAGDDMAYALWFVEEDGVTAATLFSSDGDSVEAVEDVADIDPIAWGVTIEPDTGSPQPTGDILFQGDV